MKKFSAALAVVLAVVLIIILGAKPGYALYRELKFRFGTPTQAEQTVMAFAKENGISYGKYHPDMIQLLENNPEAEDFVLHYPLRQEIPVDLSSYSRDTVPLFLQWDPMWGYETYGSSFLALTGCGPTCLAMVGYYLTGRPEMNPLDVAEFSQDQGYYASGSGSSWTLISEGSQKLGLQATELPLVKSKIDRALEAGHPVILALGPGDFTTTGHYIVLVGIQDGAYQVNDPNSPLKSSQLWQYDQLEGQIRNIWEMAAA